MSALIIRQSRFRYTLDFSIQLSRRRFLTTLVINTLPKLMFASSLFDGFGFTPSTWYQSSAARRFLTAYAADWLRAQWSVVYDGGVFGLACFERDHSYPTTIFVGVFR